RFHSARFPIQSGPPVSPRRQTKRSSKCNAYAPSDNPMRAETQLDHDASTVQPLAMQPWPCSSRPCCFRPSILNYALVDHALLDHATFSNQSKDPGMLAGWYDGMLICGMRYALESGLRRNPNPRKRLPPPPKLASPLHLRHA